MQRRELTTHCGGVRRRNFLVLLGSATAIAPVIARAQGQPIRLIGVLAGNTAVNAKERHDVFELELQRLGWKNGANLRIESRWSGGNLAQTHKHAKELVELAPDLIAAFGSV